ncbi:MAG TPA: dTDP-glucose 4,6-dehydratase [Candidatus Polarisedimenticolia bacterium]|nr:dTDP-glucose 4,6-dehydratase [Candidatus Polarisedimenticolia bacterium]
MTRVLVTGGAGFIGSNYVHHAFAAHPDWRITVLDKLTYAGNPANLASFEGHSRYRFVRGDIASRADVEKAMEGGVDVLLNFAAETHVDRSIGDPEGFIRTDVYGTYTLLEAAREHGVQRFVQISTDEVYGSVPEGSSRETDALMPSNPYSASKAGADRLAYSYFATYRLPVLITRASNNFGPRQYPEKVIPLFITNALQDQPLPLYGDGQNVRDWLYVTDHCEGLDVALARGTPGEVYNIGGGNERRNIEITEMILDRLKKPGSLVRRVEDRPGHDRRYSLDCGKLRALGWAPRAPFERALADTIAWYVEHRDWWEPLKSGEYLEYYRKQYRLEPGAPAPARPAPPRPGPG